MRIEDFKALIQEMVSEELDNMLLNERVVGTKKTRKKGTAAPRHPGGKKGAYTSAGTIPPGLKYAKGSMKSGQVQVREKIGKKMLNAITRSNKDQKAAKFRNTLERQLQKKGLPADRPNMYSQIWANATGIAKMGGTDWSIDRSKKKKGSKSKSKKASAQTQQPSSGNTPE
jgi:hypothetical protein